MGRVNVVVFDVDKTLIAGDLYKLIIDKWVAENKLRAYIVLFVRLFTLCLFAGSLRRRFEYFVFIFVDDADIFNITKRILSDVSLVNAALFRRIEKYKRANCRVVLVTASTSRIVKALSSHVDAPAYTSKSFAGVITRDLLAKKKNAYKSIVEDGGVIRTIYSDSHLDFIRSSKNILVEKNRLERYCL